MVCVPATLQMMKEPYCLWLSFSVLHQCKLLSYHSLFPDTNAISDILSLPQSGKHGQHSPDDWWVQFWECSPRSRSYLVPSGCQTCTGYSHNLWDLNSRSVTVLPKCHSQKIGFRNNVSPMGHFFKISYLHKDDSGPSNSFSLTIK